MKGTNPIRPPVMDAGQSLAVQEIFYTLQGEGVRAGQPAVFIRLGGCNLACDFCDTEFENFSTMSVADIVERVTSLRGSASDRGNPDWIASAAPRNDKGLVVITGGEPLRQPIEPLCKALIAQGHTVQIETNGTLWRELPEGVEVVCSPKTTTGQYAPIRPDVAARVTAYKYIVSATHPLYQHVPPDVTGIVYVQPMDEGSVEKNSANLAHATAIAFQHGYRLSLQLHKILGLP